MATREQGITVTQPGLTCNCTGNFVCNPGTGQCECARGWLGPDCSQQGGSPNSTTNGDPSDDGKVVDITITTVVAVLVVSIVAVLAFIMIQKRKKKEENQENSRSQVIHSQPSPDGESPCTEVLQNGAAGAKKQNSLKVSMLKVLKCTKENKNPQYADELEDKQREEKDWNRKYSEAWHSYVENEMFDIPASVNSFNTQEKENATSINPRMILPSGREATICEEDVEVEQEKAKYS